MDIYETDLDVECERENFITESLQFEEHVEEAQNSFMPRSRESTMGIVDTGQVQSNCSDMNEPMLVKEFVDLNSVAPLNIRREAVIKRYQVLNNLTQSDEESDWQTDSEDEESDSDTDFAEESVYEHLKQCRSRRSLEEEVNAHREFVKSFRVLSPKKNAVIVDISDSQPSASAVQDEPTTSRDSRIAPVRSVSEENVLKCVTMNKKLLQDLIDLEAALTSDYQQIQAQYREITQQIEIVIRTKACGNGTGLMFDNLHRLGMPYMKDRKCFPAPYNQDYYTKKARGEYLSHNSKSESFQNWSRRHRDLILEAVKKSEVEALVEKNQRERRDLESRLRECDDPEEERFLEEQLKTVIARNFDNLKLKDVLGTRQRPYDWMRISATDLDGAWTPEECMNMWDTYLSPNVNKQDWSDEENTKLLALVVEHKASDWSTIASKLGTGRTAFLCCSHYQCNLNPRLHNRRFTKMEDNQLKYQVKVTRLGRDVRWSKIEYLMKGRNRNQLMSRWTKLQPETNHGRFTVEEDLKILSMAQAPDFDFSKVKKKDLMGRPRNQVYNHFLRLTKDYKHDRWTRQEDQRIVNLVKRYGETWTKIEKFFEDRCRTQVKDRYAVIRRHMENLGGNLKEPGVWDGELPVIPSRNSRRRGAVLTKKKLTLKKILSKTTLPTALEKLEQQKKGRRKKNVVKCDPGFDDYFKAIYPQPIGRTRKLPHAPEEVTHHTYTLRNLCVLISVKLDIPRDTDAVMDNGSMPILLKQILVSLPDLPIASRHNSNVPRSTCTELNVTTDDDSTSSSLFIEFLSGPDDKDLSTLDPSVILPPPSSYQGISYSVVNSCYAEGIETVVTAPTHSKASVRPRARAKVRRPAAQPLTTDAPVTVATFTRMANSTELILDSGDAALASDMLTAPSQSGLPVEVALPVAVSTSVASPVAVSARKWLALPGVNFASKAATTPRKKVTVVHVFPKQSNQLDEKKSSLPSTFVTRAAVPSSDTSTSNLPTSYSTDVRSLDPARLIPVDVGLLRIAGSPVQAGKTTQDVTTTTSKHANYPRMLSTQLSTEKISNPSNKSKPLSPADIVGRTENVCNARVLASQPPSAPVPVSRIPRIRAIMGRLEIVKNAKTQSYASVTRRSYMAQEPVNISTSRNMLDPVPLTGIFADRALHHDTLPTKKEALDWRRHSLGAKKETVESCSLLPACTLPPCLATVVGYRTLLLSSNHLGEMLSMTTPVVSREPSSRFLNAKKLWKERCQTLFTIPCLMSKTQYRQVKYGSLGDPTAFLDPDNVRQMKKYHVAVKTAPWNGAAKYQRTTIAQYGRQRRVRPVVVESDDVEVKSDDAEVESDDAEVESDDTEVESDDTEDESDDAEVKSDDAEVERADAEVERADAEVESDDAEDDGDVKSDLESALTSEVIKGNETDDNDDDVVNVANVDVIRSVPRRSQVSTRSVSTTIKKLALPGRPTRQGKTFVDDLNMRIPLPRSGTPRWKRRRRGKRTAASGNDSSTVDDPAPVRAAPKGKRKRSGKATPVGLNPSLSVADPSSEKMAPMAKRKRTDETTPAGRNDSSFGDNVSPRTCRHRGKRRKKQ